MENQAESLMVQVKNEDTDKIKKALLNTPTSVIIYEMTIVSLMEGVLEDDIILPRLVVCGVRTISPLHYASLRGADVILKEFLKENISPEYPLSNGSTCLHFACFSGALGTVKMLLENYSADIRKADSYGWPALHYASIGGQLEVVEELCTKRINIMHRDQDGTTAAYRAKIFGHQAVVDLFDKISKSNPSLLNVKEKKVKDEKIYSQPKKENLEKNVVSAKEEDKQFIKDNNYDNPDDLVTKIHCKYVPFSEDNVNDGNFSNDQIIVNNSVYDLPSEKKTSKNDDYEKEKNLKKIQALVESQFKDIFLENSIDPYLQPITSSNDLYSTVGSSNVQNIGFKTLKLLLRTEFQKLKSSYNTFPENSSESPTESTKNLNTLFNEHNIYEEITKGSSKDKKNKWVKGGETLKVTRNQRPPLPPRNSMLAKPTSQLYANTESNFNNDFSQASQKLSLIEETQFVKEACFSELIYALEPGDWQKLAKHLPLRNSKSAVEEKIKKIEKQYPKNFRKQAKIALSDWNQYYGKKASIQKLLDALKKSKLLDKVKEIELATQREFNA